MIIKSFFSLHVIQDRSDTREELTQRGRDGAPPLDAVQRSGLFLRGSGLDAPGGAALALQRLLLSVVIFHVVVQQLGLAE